MSSNAAFSTPPEVGRFQQRALVVGVIALALTVVGAFFDKDQFFRSYLVAYLFWIGIALGSLALMMVQYLSGGGWGIVTQRLFEAAARTIVPLGLVLFIPILLGLNSLYEWTHADVVRADPVLQHKTPYLNIPFFIGRAAFYFLVWWWLTSSLSRWSREYDQTGDPLVLRRLQDRSGPGLVLYGLTVTFAAVDWVMSLDPHWFSTIFGLLLMAGQGVSAMAFVIAVAVLLARREPLDHLYQPRHMHDLGKLLLALIMLWAYFAFSQLLIIWSGNLPEEIPWYLRRFNSNWRYLGLALIVLHFALPFMVLLSRDLKRNGRKLVLVALLVLAMRLGDLIWQVVPDVTRGGGLASAWIYIAAAIGIGGIWISYYLRQLQTRPLVPLKDPHLSEALEVAHHH